MQNADDLRQEARIRLDAINDTTDRAIKRKPATRSFDGPASGSLMPIHKIADQVGTPGVYQMMTSIRVILADDHSLVRAGLRSLLVGLGGIEIVGEATDGREAIDMVAKHQPRLVLMDLVMPGLGGVEATRRIVKEYPHVRVVILSMHTGDEYVLEALRAGASSYIHKDSPPRLLKFAIEAVARGEIFLGPIVSKHVIEGYLSRANDQISSLEQLTSRQREILQLVSEGSSSKQIAGLLNTSVKTIDSHRTNIMERLGVHNVPGLVRYAIRHGLVSADK
jgi:DNA-binding NarL/FixJ family response regulator